MDNMKFIFFPYYESLLFYFKKFKVTLKKIMFLKYFSHLIQHPIFIFPPTSLELDIIFMDIIVLIFLFLFLKIFFSPRRNN